jgi:sulfatase maturation enzyme AslB (radical SAM superfamily)
MMPQTAVREQDDQSPRALQDTFCVVPWIHRFTDEQGFSGLCAVADRDEGFLRDADGKQLNVSQLLTDEQVLNSPTAKAARLQMMHGEWPKACERCRRNEASGATSVRHHLNVQHERGRRQEWLADTAPDGALGHPLVRFADIRLGNVCNLTCRMCGPNASRLWAPIHNKLQPENYRLPESDLVQLGQNNWVKHDSVQALIGQNLEGLERMHFAGGEPLIIPEMVQALEMCIASGRAGEIELSYNTNLTVLPPKVTSLWKHFKHTSLLCSVDGFGQVTEYIRRPSKWTDIDRNIKVLDQHFDEWRLKSAKLSATVQIYNLLTLHDLFAYLRGAGLKRFAVLPHFVPLFHPPYLSIQALPKAAKELARQRLTRELNRPEARQQEGYQHFAGCIANVLAFMDEADTTSSLPEFFQFCESSDRQFGDSWRAALPELARALDPNRRARSWPSWLTLRSNP